jgi:hypothetical protein
MRNKIIYTVPDELLNEDIYSTIRSDLQKYWTPKEQQQQQQQTEEFVDQKTKEIYVNLQNQLKNLLLTKNRKYITPFDKRYKIVNLIFKKYLSNPQKTNKITIFEQQENINFDIVNGILQQLNLNDKENEEILKYLKIWIENINKENLETTLINKIKVVSTQQNISRLTPEQRLIASKTFSEFIAILKNTINNYVKDNNIKTGLLRFVQGYEKSKPRKKPNDQQIYKYLFDTFKNIFYVLQFNNLDNVSKHFAILGVKYYKQILPISELKDIAPIHIDFTKANQLNESFLVMFGTAIKAILQRMFGQDVYIPQMSISGTPQQMETFVKTLAGEKRYFDSYVQYGLNDPRTYQDRYKLQASVNEFERNTGIKWPFK